MSDSHAVAVHNRSTERQPNDEEDEGSNKEAVGHNEDK